MLILCHCHHVRAARSCLHAMLYQPKVAESSIGVRHTRTVRKRPHGLERCSKFQSTHCGSEDRDSKRAAETSSWLRGTMSAEDGSSSSCGSSASEKRPLALQEVYIV